MHASFNANGCLANLDKRVGKIGILSTSAPAIDISYCFFRLNILTKNEPGDVNKLRTKVPHTLDTVVEILQTLGNVSFPKMPDARCPSATECHLAKQCITYLSSPGREEFKTPEGSTLLLSLLQLLGDLHDGLERK